MRKLSIVLLALVSIIISCDKLSQLTQYEVPLSEKIDLIVTDTIFLDETISIEVNDVETNIEELTKDYKSELDLIDEITLKSFKVKIEEPVNGDFGAIKEVAAYVSADGISEIKVASKENIQDNQGGEIELETASEDLAQFIKKDKINIRLESITDKDITESHKFQVDVVFLVDAKIFGL